jgi:VWFA-related protein
VGPPKVLPFVLFFAGLRCLAQSAVMVPVVVHDSNGRVVADLRKDDFLLFDKDQPQAIASFSKEPTATPEHFTAWVFDDLKFGELSSLTRMRAAALREIASLQPSDRVGVFTTSCQVVLDFTGNQARMRDALAHLSFRPRPICPALKARFTQFAVLDSVVRRMAALPAQRSIILMSPGFFVGPDRARERESLIDLAVRSKVAINTMDVDGPVAATNAMALIEVVHGTGGSYVSGGDFEGNLRRLMMPASRYVVAFVPAPGAADGTFHPLKVKLKDPRPLDVQARDGYLAPAPKATVISSSVQAPAAPTRRLLAQAVQDPGAAAPRPAVAAAIPPRPVAPEESPTAEITSRDEPLAFQVSAGEVLVPVVVHGADSHAVGNLRKEDFEITDNDKPRKIAKFSVLRASTVHYIGYLFDDARLAPADLARTCDALRQHLASLRPGDRAGIFTTSGAIPPLEFTADRAKLDAALLKLQPPVRAITDQESMLTLSAVLDVVHRMSTLPARRDIVLFSPGLPQGDTSAVIEQANRASVVINAFAIADSPVLAALTDGTGGVNGTDLTRLETLPEYSYMLGFLAEGVKPDGSLHTLRVALRTPGGLTVQARSGYSALKRSDDAAEAATEDIERAVFSRDEITSLPVDLSTRFLRSGDKARLTVIASLDLRQLHFRKSSGRNYDDVRVVASLFDDQWNFIAGAEKLVQFHLSDATKKRIEPGPPVAVRTVFDLKSGSYRVRLVVHDAEGHHLGATTRPVVIP